MHVFDYEVGNPLATALAQHWVMRFLMVGAMTSSEFIGLDGGPQGRNLKSCGRMFKGRYRSAIRSGLS